MKTVTVTLSSDVYHRAHARAAELGTSLSALVSGFVEQLAAEDLDFARLQCEQNELIARIRARHPGFSPADRLPRPRIHERDSLR
ncbi:MAG: hypothetical protein ACOYLX_15825 [Burkholderiaceae bacterium]